MNVINIKDKLENFITSDITISTYDSDYVKKINITVNENATIYLNTSCSDAKLNIEINIRENIKANIFELKNGSNNKIQYVYNLNHNSELYVFKFNDTLTIKERNIFNLKELSTLNYNFKTIAKSSEEYDYIINHKGSNSVSNLSANGVSIMDGSILFNITGEVFKGVTECIVNEESRIVPLNDNESIIKPNLLIDEYNVSANHSALIGRFSNEEVFYLQSRGISKEEAYNLLIKGFLISNLEPFKDKEDELKEIINKYWR